MQAGRSRSCQTGGPDTTRWMQTRATLISVSNSLSRTAAQARECSRTAERSGRRLEAEQIKVVRYRCSASFKHENVISDRTVAKGDRVDGGIGNQTRRGGVVLFPFRPREHRRELSVKREEVRLETERVRKRRGEREKRNGCK